MTGPEVFLYTSTGCHLCEQAEAMLGRLLGESFRELQHVEVSDSDALMERYALRIPVLAGRAADESGNGKGEGEWLELGWPFDETAISAFFARIEP